MPRSLALIALILMLLTGLVLGQISSLNRTTAPIAGPSDDGSADTAHAFYAAVNEFLQTGDAGNLTRLLAPGFIDHADHSTAGAPAGELIRYLESVRLTFPGLRLEASNLSAQAETVAVDVTLVGRADGAFAGVAVEAGVGQSGYEVLRVEGTQIVERWGSRALPPLFGTIIASDLPFPRDGFPEVRIDRLSIEPHGFGEFVDHDGFILIAESGEIAFQIVRLPEEQPAFAGTAEPGFGPQIPQVGASATLSGTASVVAPPGTRFRISNGSETTGTALMVSIRQKQLGPVARSASAYQVIDSVGFERTFLSGGGVGPEPYRTAVFSVVIGRAELSSGVLIPRHETGAAELLLIENGSIEAVMHRGALLWRSPGSSVGVEADARVLTAGQAGQLETGSVVEYRAGDDGPASVLLVTVGGGQDGHSEDPTQQPETA